MKLSIPLLWFVALVWPLAVRATNNGRDAARETAIEQQLARLDPTLVDSFKRATIACDAKNYPEAERLFAQICRRFPDFDPALRRLGTAKVLQGRRQEGLALVEKAVAINRSSDNLASLAYDLAFTAQGSTPEQDRALNLLLEARTRPNGDDADILCMTAQLAIQRGKDDLARQSVDRLKDKYPELMQTHYFAAYFAASDEQWNRAVKEIRAAEKLGLPSEAVNKFLDSGVQSRATGWFVAGSAAWLVGLWVTGLIVLFALGFGLSKATLRQVERSDPTVPISGAEHRLRQVYRCVLNFAGIYYYISLPVVLLIVVAAAAGVIYGFLLIGRLPIQLTVILVVGAFATVAAMVRSVFLRVKPSDPGRALERREAPGLWQLAEEVAGALQTRAVDEIRLTMGTDLCVYERGTWREKFENRAKRILVIGTAVLDGFRQEDFRSVLAHEYGHFSNRDTAGGDIAFRVQNDMLKFYFAMRAAGQATWINLGFHFLRVYHLIFRRISHGATRLQEVLADRVAAQTYGVPAFEGGLRHVIRQAIAFDAHANAEIASAIKARRPLQNLYAGELSLAQPAEEQFAKAMNRDTTDDDTHPAPKDRFRLIAKIPPTSRPPSPGMVWDLFTDRAAIVAEMTATVEAKIAGHRS